MEKPAFIRVSLSDVRVIMTIMRVPVVGLLCEAVTDRFQHSSTCCQVHVGACGHNLSYQTLNVTASRGPGSCGAYSVLKAHGHGCREPGRVLSWGNKDLPWANK
jgi:hypothetical protein